MPVTDHILYFLLCDTCPGLSSRFLSTMCNVCCSNLLQNEEIYMMDLFECLGFRLEVGLRTLSGPNEALLLVRLSEKHKNKWCEHEDCFGDSHARLMHFSYSLSYLFLSKAPINRVVDSLTSLETKAPVTQSFLYVFAHEKL